MSVCAPSKSRTSPRICLDKIQVPQPLVKSTQQTNSSLGMVAGPPSKRAGNNDCDEEGMELLSASKRPRLDLLDDSRELVAEKVTKVADSPVSKESMINEPANEELMDDKPVKDELVKPSDVESAEECMDKESIPEEKCLENNSNMSEQNEAQVKSSQIWEDKLRLNSGDTNDQDEQERQDNQDKRDESTIQVMFSDDDCEESEGVVGGGAVDGREMMLSSQMNRQIDRVQVFLKMERLRRPKK